MVEERSFKLKVKKMHKLAKLPTKAYPLEDAGFDVYSVVDVTVQPRISREGKNTVPSFAIPPNLDPIEIRTGIAIAVPVGYYTQVSCRSGLGKKGLRVHPGVIDSGYRAELSILVQNHGNKPIEIKVGDKVAQLLILPVPNFIVEEVAELPVSSRKTSGFGSSGK